MRYTILVITALALLNFSNAAPIASDNSLQIANQMAHKAHIDIAKREEVAEDGNDLGLPGDGGKGKGNGNGKGKGKGKGKSRERSLVDAA